MNIYRPIVYTAALIAAYALAGCSHEPIRHGPEFIKPISIETRVSLIDIPQTQKIIKKNQEFSEKIIEQVDQALDIQESSHQDAQKTLGKIDQIIGGMDALFSPKE